LAIVCVSEYENLGTAGAIKNCLHEVETDRVLILNCDDLCDMNIKALSNIDGDVICVHSPKIQFGIIKENKDQEKKKFSFVEKPVLENLWTSCGWYLLNKETIKSFPLKGSIEYNVFPKLDFNIYKHLGRWDTFNTQKDIELFETENM